MEVVSATHFLSGWSALSSRYRLVGSHLCAWLASGSDSAMAWTLRKESLFSHQTSYPFAGALNALCAQLCMNTWTAIDTAIGLESHFHLLCSLGIFSAMLTGSPFAPGRVSTRLPPPALDTSLLLDTHAGTRR